MIGDILNKPVKLNESKRKFLHLKFKFFDHIREKLYDIAIILIGFKKSRFQCGLFKQMLHIYIFNGFTYFT